MSINLKGCHCLVLGGSGFIGANLCRGLLDSGATVRSLALDAPSPAVVADDVQSNVEWIYGNFADLDLVYSALRNIDIVFHLISTTLPDMSNKDVKYDLASNLLPTIQLLEAAKNSKIKKMIFISSGGTVYGIPKNIPITENHETHPICAYGIHKLAIEKYLNLFHHLWELDYGILRVSNPYGINQPTNRPQGVIANFLHRLANHEPIEIWGDGNVVRDYIHIDDVIEAFLLLIDHRGPNRLFNIGTGKGYTILELISMIETISGRKVEVRYREGRRVDVPSNILDVNLAKSELCWKPNIDLEHGMYLMLEHAGLSYRAVIKSSLKSFSRRNSSYI
jgi:UDP-glucose 4-epimerase